MKNEIHEKNVFENAKFNLPVFAGLFGIIQMRQKLFHNKCDPILLLAPNDIETWLTFYDSEIEPISSDYELIDNRLLVRQFN